MHWMSSEDRIVVTLFDKSIRKGAFLVTKYQKRGLKKRSLDGILRRKFSNKDSYDK